jgi:hypothetical protein
MAFRLLCRLARRRPGTTERRRWTTLGKNYLLPAPGRYNALGFQLLSVMMGGNSLDLDDWTRSMLTKKIIAANQHSKENRQAPKEEES